MARHIKIVLLLRQKSFPGYFYRSRSASILTWCPWCPWCLSRHFASLIFLRQSGCLGRRPRAAAGNHLFQTSDKRQLRSESVSETAERGSSQADAQHAVSYAPQDRLLRLFTVLPWPTPVSNADIRIDRWIGCWRIFKTFLLCLLLFSFLCGAVKIPGSRGGGGEGWR